MRFSDKSIIYIGSLLAGSLLPLLMSMVMVRCLSKYDYGTFRQIMLIAVLVPTCVALGLPQSLSYFIPRARSPKEKKQLALQIFACLLLLGAAAAVGGYLLQNQISARFSNPALIPLAWIFSLYLLFIVPGKCAQVTLLSLGRIKLASLLEISTHLFSSLFVVIPLLLGKGLEVVLLSMVAYYALEFVLVLSVLLTLEGGFPKLFDWEILRAQARYSLPLWLSFIIGAARVSGDKFLVAFLYRPEDFAVYSRGAFELPLVGLVPFALSSLLVPRFAELYSRGDIGTILSLWQEAARKVSQLFFPLFVFSFIFAEEIITLLFTADYHGSVEIFRIYLCLLPLRLVSYKTILSASGHTKPILGSAMMALVASILLGVTLQATLGLTGPAIGNVAGEVLGFWYLLRHSRKVLRVSWTELVPISKLAQPAWASLLMGAAIFPFHWASPGNAAMVLLFGMGYVAAYVTFMRMSRFFTEEDWALIRRCATLKVLRELK
ncbi:MAG: polysaccharide biosynthesis protein [Deltaproteobacteria bacterium]|nr:polysaccharide biosynthesis protein [Deltaproteobacteria bacterium]